MLFGWFASFNLGHLQQSLGWTRGALPLKRWWGIKLLFLFFANDAAIAVLMVRGINDWKDWNVLCSCSDLVRHTHSKDVTVQSGTYSQKQGFLKSWQVPKMYIAFLNNVCWRSGRWWRSFVCFGLEAELSFGWWWPRPELKHLHHHDDGDSPTSNVYHDVCFA